MILLTGGLGYIGSHTAVKLLDKNLEIVIVDNLSNSNLNVVDKIKKITNKDFLFYKLDLLDFRELNRVLNEHNIEYVIHFAGLKSVNESVEKPLLYYENNIIGSINLLKAMKKNNVNNIIFSSSATVYDSENNVSPLSEDTALRPINPYGWTKLFIERIINDVTESDKDFKAIHLRYFNPVGAHQSGIIGENPKGIPNNLMPYIMKVASKKLDRLKIFGDDYNTKDGTGVRDYIHVEDLAYAHYKALKKIRDIDGIEIYNIGRGKGISVLEIVETFEKVNNTKVPYVITSRREGDVATCYADCEKAKSELGFTTEKTLEDMCRDSWNFEKSN